MRRESPRQLGDKRPQPLPLREHAVELEPPLAVVAGLHAEMPGAPGEEGDEIGGCGRH
jgi:hypothetical protein